VIDLVWWHYAEALHEYHIWFVTPGKAVVEATRKKTKTEVRETSFTVGVRDVDAVLKELMKKNNVMCATSNFTTLA